MDATLLSYQSVDEDNLISLTSLPQGGGCSLQDLHSHRETAIVSNNSTSFLAFTPFPMSSVLPPYSAEAFAFLQQHDPRFVALVDHRAKRNRQGSRSRALSMPLARFGEDFLLLYAALRYASTQGVKVTIVPETDALPS